MKDLEGFEGLAKDFAKAARELPKKSLPKATRKGAAILLRAVAAAAPQRTGALRQGFVLRKEHSRQEGKAVYDLMPDPKKNDIFQKPIAKPVRSKSSNAYYPASQEYGFFTRRPDGGMAYTKASGETAMMEKVPGKYFMRRAAETSEAAVESTILGELTEAIERSLGGKDET